MILKSIIRSFLVISIITILAFPIHLFVNRGFNIPISFAQLVYTYTINLLLVCFVMASFFLLSRKLEKQLGFIFMFSSIFKFAAFFIFLYPRYNNDGDLSKYEFLAFFIPYAIYLIVESVILSKFLNSLDSDK